MTSTYTLRLGETWEEAIKNAYTHGYRCWEHSHAGIVDEAREIERDDGKDAAQDYLSEMDWVITEGSDNRELWWAIDRFYEEHMSEEMNERYQREAAVAEDLQIAFEAGCRDAILGIEHYQETVSHLY